MTEHHSIPTTLERVNYEPALWKGLTGFEILWIGVVNVVIFGVIGTITGVIIGIWPLGFGVGIIVGIFMLGVVGGKVSMMKETKPPELFWVDVQLKILKRFKFKTSLFYKKQVWSLERNRK